MFKSIDLKRIKRQTTVKTCRIWRSLPAIWRKAIATCIILIVLFLVMKWIAGLVSLPLSGIEAMDCKDILAKVQAGESITMAEALRFEGYGDAIRSYDWAKSVTTGVNGVIGLAGACKIFKVWKS